MNETEAKDTPEAVTYTQEQFDEQKTKLNEFRENNTALLKEQTANKAKYEGIDLDKYATLVKAQKDIDDKKMIDAGQVDELVTSRVKDIQVKNALEVTKLNELNSKQNTQIEVLVVDNAVRSASSKEGVVGVDDMILRSKSVFKVLDGKAVAFDNAGNQLYQEDAQTPITVQDWVKSQKEVAPYLFKSPTGTNAIRSNNNITMQNTSEMSPMQKISQGLKDNANK